MTYGMTVLICFMVFPFVFLLLGLKFAKVQKTSRLRGYKDIQIGMPEEEMLWIMRGGYSRSLLQDGRVKYEWRTGATSSTSFVGSGNVAFGSTKYHSAKAVSIFVKDDVVDEVQSNIPM